MKEYSRKNLNIKRLLELGDLDIRGISAEDEALSANKYFYRVESFIESALQIRDEFLPVKYTDDELIEKEDFYGNLKNTLSEIGYCKLNNDIDNICDSIRTKDLTAAKNLIDEALIKFNKLYDRIKTAYSVKKFTALNSVQTVSSNEIVSLEEALEYFDYEEENRKLRILAVDDVSVVLNSITSILSPYYEVFALKNSAHVENFLRHTTPELFLLDIEMDGINGFDLVPLIRSFEEHKNTPIIFLTGNASIDNLKGAIELGACDFITKPLDKDVLIEKIEKNIIRKKAY